MERVLREVDEELARPTRTRREGWTIERVVARASETCGVEAEEICSGSKATAASRGRSLRSYWAVKELGMSAAEAPRVLGLTRQAAGVATRRGKSWFAAAASDSMICSMLTSYQRPVRRSGTYEIVPQSIQCDCDGSERKGRLINSQGELGDVCRTRGRCYADYIFNHNAEDW